MALFRSWMFVPGSDPKKLAKIPQLQFDVIIYDLEDAVALSEKETARYNVKSSLRQHQGRCQVVRVNSVDSPYFREDVKELGAEGCWGIMLPKCESKEQVEAVNELLDQLEQERGLELPVRIIPILETALGLHHIHDIAQGRRVQCLAFGSIDYTLDIGAELTSDGFELLLIRSQMVQASRVFGIQPPIDTVFADFRDSIGLEKETRLIKSLGFQGKLVIHPQQIETVNKVFTPTQAELEHAKAIVSAYDQSIREGAGAVQVQGKMIDLPVVEKAKRTLILGGQG